jgi:hypothetical protein
MPTPTLLKDSPHPNRILADLVESRLDDDEIDTLTLWLAASAPRELPETIIARGLQARGTYARFV